LSRGCCEDFLEIQLTVENFYVTSTIICVNIFMLIDFKIKGKRISKSEKEYLKNLSLKWCAACKCAKTEINFYKTASCCKICSDLKTKKSKEPGSNFHKKFYSKDNEDKRKKSARERSKKYRNTFKYKLKRSQWKKNKRLFDPIWKLKENLRSSLARIKKGAKEKGTFKYLSVNSIEEFIYSMSEKTDNKNWIQENYHIDHIWQISWFSDYMLKDPELVLRLVNNHSNLRPLRPKDNTSRNKYDFTPLNKDDFPKYENYLNFDIKAAIQEYFIK
jgi:hypothetical protein